MRPTILIAAIAAALPASAPAFAEGFVDLAALEARVVAFTGIGVGEAGGPAAPIDRRLRLAACATPPALDWRAPRRDAVVVSCAAPGWRIFVPLKGQGAGATGMMSAVAPATPVAAATPKPLVIRRGDPVSIVAAQAGFSVSQQGVAAADAAAGSRLAVRIDGSRATVQTVAVDAGLATLPGY